MMTINLEKSLIRENRKLATPAELLQIQEHDKFATLVGNDVLVRLGIGTRLQYGKQVKETINARKEQTKKFNQERVFHISQIEAICKRYRLRFLRSHLYMGSIDAELPNRITNFEIAYGLVGDKACTKYNTYIVAPAESFDLKSIPADPLMFYEINDSYYYLIHKWGNDLSIYREVLGLAQNGWFTWLVVSLIILPLLSLDIPLAIALLIGWSGIYLACQKLAIGIGGSLAFLETNDWRSKEI